MSIRLDVRSVNDVHFPTKSLNRHFSIKSNFFFVNNQAYLRTFFLKKIPFNKFINVLRIFLNENH